VSSDQLLGAPAQIHPLTIAICDDGKLEPAFGICVPEQVPTPVSLFIR
jgi:hypothetical protein